METTTNPALLDPNVRAALKKQQLARLEAKAKVRAGEMTTEEYCERLRATQSERIAQNAAAAEARKAIKAARNSQLIRDAEESAKVFGG